MAESTDLEEAPYTKLPPHEFSQAPGYPFSVYRAAGQSQRNHEKKGPARPEMVRYECFDLAFVSFGDQSIRKR